MHVLIGLGNVGEKYKNNRHNVGFILIDVLSKASKSNNIALYKSGTMMNTSGIAVKKFVEKHNLDIKNLYIIHDDLDLKLGEYKIQFGKGPKVHNGVNSVEESLGTSEFWRIRIGVDNRDPENRISGEKYVLQDFKDDELEIINNAIKNAAHKLWQMIKK